MCGIVGYAGNIETACGKPLEVCLQGLERLEYRGYDSAGVALTAPGMDKVVVRKKAGRLKNLVEDIERKPMPLATVGIGHTRWATNGEPSDVNAHPHTSMDGKVAIIHNGIIENASQLRLDLQVPNSSLSKKLCCRILLMNPTFSSLSRHYVAPTRWIGSTLDRRRVFLWESTTPGQHAL